MIHRVDVRVIPAPRDVGDPPGESIRQQITELGVDIGSISTSRIFLIDTDAAQRDIERIARELLTDQIIETAELLSQQPRQAPANSRIEIHLKPGVMDPVAASTEM